MSADPLPSKVCADVGCSREFSPKHFRQKYCGSEFCVSSRKSSYQVERRKRDPKAAADAVKYYKSERFAEVRRQGYLRRLAKDPVLQAAVESYKSGLGYFGCAKKHSIPRSRVASTIRALGIQRSHNASVRKAPEDRSRTRSYPNKHVFRRGQAKEIYERVNGICEYCFGPVSPYVPETGDRDWCCHHILPVAHSLEHADESFNGALLHRSCHKNNSAELHGFGSFNPEETNCPSRNGIYCCWVPNR